MPSTISDKSKDIPISEKDFSKRYDEVIARLNTLGEECNLILQTKIEKASFKVYKNSNNSITVISGEEKSKLSFPKNELIDIVYRGKTIDYHKSYIEILIEKIIDNSIFAAFSENSSKKETDSFTTAMAEEKIKILEEERLITTGKLSDLEDKFNARQKDFENLQTILQQASTVEKDFQDAKDAVLEDLKVKESYKYWETQVITYTKKYWQYLSASIIMTVLLLIGVFLFLHYNPLIIETVQTPPQEMSSEDTLIKTPGTDNISISTKSLQIWEYGFLLLLTTMVIWLIRIATKITLSNYHLSIDANERVIMIKTYLALIKEASGYDENDKKVILDNIFRPTNFGIIKDETNVTLTDVISSFKK